MHHVHRAIQFTEKYEPELEAEPLSQSWKKGSEKQEGWFQLLLLITTLESFGQMLTQKKVKKFWIHVQGPAKGMSEFRF